MFHPMRFSLATSCPTWNPPKSCRNWVAQPLVPLAPNCPRLVLIVELPLNSTSPPTPRTHTPLPCESGLGLGGALTKAVLCVRKTEFAASIDETIPPAADDTPVNIGPSGAVPPVPPTPSLPLIVIPAL